MFNNVVIVCRFISSAYNDAFGFSLCTKKIIQKRTESKLRRNSRLFGTPLFDPHFREEAQPPRCLLHRTL